jgi:PAS domain S-box-containing protein
MSESDDGAAVVAHAHPRAEHLLSELAELVGSGSQGLSAMQAGRRVLRRAMAALGARRGAALVNDSLGARFEIREGLTWASWLEVANEALTLGEAWLTTARAVDARFPRTGPRRTQATASVRLEMGGREVGGLALEFDEERDFPEHERTFLRAVGRILANLVDRASLWKADLEAKKRARWAKALGDAYRLIAGPVSLDGILDDLARVSCETPCDFSAIRVLSEDGKSLVFRGVHHRDPEQLARIRGGFDGHAMPAMIGHTAGVLVSGTSLLVREVDHEQLRRDCTGTAVAAYVEQFPPSTAMIVPLRMRGAVCGVVTVTRADPEPFDEADLRFLEEVASRAAAALDNAELYQRLAHSEEQLRVALEAGRLGAWDWDIRTQRITWSGMLEKIHGLDAGSFPGTFEAFQRDIHPDDRPRVLATIAGALEEQSTYDVMYRIMRPDDEVRWLEAHGTVLRDGSGAAQRMVGVCQDVTERRRSDEQLRATLLALREADQRKDQFLAMLAHELRNPLTPILYATHLLAAPRLEEASAARARKTLDRQVKHMTRLLDDLLDVSRIARDRIELTRELFDVVALAREVVDDHLESFRAAGLTLDLTTPAGSLTVFADRTRIAQVIGNLLSNALKFSPPGKSVHVRLDREASGRSLVLAVRDEGSGILPDLLDRVFEPFVQADTSLARPRGGLGLGLAVVKGIVTLHGGRVSASSPGPGGGAELNVELPLHAPVLEVREPTVVTTEVASSARVLLFEDNADAAETLRELLSAAGYQVWVEATGRRAVELVRTLRPHLVLCDLGLPDRDGFAVASDLRSHRETSRLPLIALTGYGTLEDQERARRAGFDLHLTKPVPPALLLAELSRLLTK